MDTYNNIINTQNCEIYTYLCNSPPSSTQETTEVTQTIETDQRKRMLCFYRLLFQPLIL